MSGLAGFSELLRHVCLRIAVNDVDEGFADRAGNTFGSRSQFQVGTQLLEQRTTARPTSESGMVSVSL